MGTAIEKALLAKPRDPIVDKNGIVTPMWSRWFGNLVNKSRRIESYSVTINPASVAANTTAEQTFTVTGMEVESVVNVTKPSLTAGLGIGNARVSAADTLAITFINATAAPINPPEEEYKVVEIRL